MRSLLLFVPALVCTAQDADLPARLARAGSLPTEELRTLQARLAADPTPAEKKAYQEAHLAYQLAGRLRESDPKACRALVERTLKALESRRDPESRALMGALLGLKIGYEPMAGMALSPQAMGLFEDAATLAPASPRVRLLMAVHVLHMPAFVGGGPKAALPLLEKAVQLAQAEPPAADPWAPSWGKVETLSWLAFAQYQAGQFAQAKATADRALAVDPHHGFLQKVVLPALQPKVL